VPQAIFWLSGSNEGENCDVHQKYSWCSAGAPFPAALEPYWLNKVVTTVTNTTDRCIAYKKSLTTGDTHGFMQKNCDEPNSFLCESNVTCNSLTQTCVADVRTAMIYDKHFSNNYSPSIYESQFLNKILFISFSESYFFLFYRLNQICLKEFNYML